MPSRLVFVCVLSVWIASPPPVAAEEAPGVVMERLAGGPVTGRLQGLDGTQVSVLQPRGVDPVATPLGEVIHLRFPAPATPAKPLGALRVTLTGGEVVRGALQQASEDDMTLRVASLPRPLVLPIEAIRHVERLEGTSTGCDRPALRRPAEKDQDVVWLAGSGDRVVGTLVSANANAVEMEDAEGRATQVPWSRVSVIHLVNPPPETTPALQCEIETRDGCRLQTAAPPTLRGTSLHGALRSWPERTFVVPLAQVSHVRYSGPRFVHASDLPFTATYTPYHPAPEDAPWVAELAQRRWAPRANRRGDDGCPLQVDGVVFRRGFYAHSKSTIRIPLEGGFASFRCVFGILDDDPKSPTRNRRRDLADVDVRVVADGKELWSRKGVGVDDGRVEIGPLDLGTAQVLELIVDHGKHMDVCDDVAWGAPILVRR